MRYEWSKLYDEALHCSKCTLSHDRHNVVIGMGNPSADIMIIGEGPGHDEDMQGLPFVGNAGKLLDKILASIDLSRSNTYIANVVKCRPPQNRTPLPDEALQCLPFLRAQVALVNPKIIVCMGATAVKYVLGEDVRITKDRGTWYHIGDVWILPTYHPAALLYDETKKRFVWEDMKKLRNKIGELGINIMEE